jgi:pimeloyl-ACP methyl ester carboxylesterase
MPGDFIMSYKGFPVDNTPEFDQLYGGIRPEAFELGKDARAETTRLAWSPFLHNSSLPHLLVLIDGLPTLPIWGREDEVSPLAAGEEHAKAIGGSKLVGFDKCGHIPEVELTADFLREVRSFLC